MAEMDPRLKERRIVVARESGRRRLRRLVAVASVITVVVLLGWAVFGEPLDIDELSVTGNARLDAEEVLDAAAVEVGDPILLAERGAIGERLGAVPLIAEVVIRRELPGSLAIDIVEWEPAAQAPAAGGGWGLLDSDGLVLHVQKGEDDVLPAIEVGPTRLEVGRGASAGLVDAVRTVVSIPEELAGVIDVVAVTREGEVVVRLANEAATEVLFGRGPEPSVAFEALGRLVARTEQVGLACAEVVDLTSPETPGVRRAAACSER